MKILSILTGKPQTVTFRGKAISTRTFKSPIAEPVMLKMTNLDGDGQADLKIHGGRDKALYAYPFDIDDAWANKVEQRAQETNMRRVRNTHMGVLVLKAG